MIRVPPHVRATGLPLPDAALLLQRAVQSAEAAVAINPNSVFDRVVAMRAYGFAGDRAKGMQPVLRLNPDLFFARLPMAPAARDRLKQWLAPVVGSGSRQFLT